MNRPLVIFFFLNVAISWQCAATLDQPRLQSVDGHLFITAAKDKNITILTSSRGYLNLNGINLMKTVQNAVTATSSKEGRISQLEDDVKVLTSRLEDAFVRLNVCESSSGNGQEQGSSATPRSIRDLNNKVSRLQKQVRGIIRNLTKNECQNDPCLNGGTCLDRYLDFECQCEKGWEGKRCEKDINECAQFAGTDLGCQNGATCINKRGSYECVCSPGWFGLHCTRRQNDCSSASSTELCGHGTCVTLTSGSKGFKCICDQGWTTNGVDPACTLDIDECSIAPCSRNPPVLCHNTPGGFFCGSCPPGYTGNGFVCEDINECLIQNGGCSVQPMVQCINTAGSSNCGPCPPGYAGDGRICTFVGKCRVNNGGCHPSARCYEIGSNVQCQCLPGYTGFGAGINGCVIIPGGSPTSNNPCEPNPCRNFGRCISRSSTNFTCSCRFGFSGPTCEIARDPCESNPCENGGTCRRWGRLFTCTCPSNFRGRRCQIEKQSCGGYLETDDGELQYPTSGSAKYSNNLSCAWIVTVNHTKVIKITFENFDLEPGETCQSDWLQIHDGRTTGDNLIGKYCGNSLPNNGSITTSGNNVYLWFRSDRNVNKMGFKLKWNATDPVCGGEVNASIHGTIRSPGSPGRYPPNRDCNWMVIAPLGQRITFTFFEVHIEAHQNCSYDFLAIHESADINSPIIAKICNTTTPAPLVTPGNTALVHFHSDRFGSDRGFQIAYHPTPGYPGCGGIFTAKRGEIKPPTVDGTYVHNLDCAWVIRLPEDFRIKLTFRSMSIEISTTCYNDYLEIRDGGDIYSDLIGKYCGNTVPAPISSSTNQLYIRFNSDYSVSGSGFRITYQSLCSKTFTSDSGIITSPGYPKPYRNDDECIYKIEQPPGKIIELQFQEFAMEFSFSCTFDYLEVRDGHDENSPKIGKYCGQDRPPTIVSTHNYLWMKLRTDRHLAFGGFYINYTTTDVACGGIYKEPTGTIRSPIRDSEYPPNHVCTWVIAGGPGDVISLTFTSFKIEHQLNCLFDSVSIYDNTTTAVSDGLMGRFCGRDIPPPMTSTGNIITIIFKTDSSFNMEGFTATYSFINMSSACGGNYFSSTGTIRSPNYPNYYPPNKNCIWVLKVAYGRKISLNVRDFRLEEGFFLGKHSCFDRLEIRDGGYENSPLIGSYCGTNIPKRITSQSNSLHIKFYSDSASSNSGFKITWDGTLNGCGGTLTSFSGTIQSPNYPQPYGSNSDCNYKISVASGSKVQLSFMDLEMEDTPECVLDYIEIFDGPDKTSKSLGKYCNPNNHPPTIVSSGNTMYITFRSDMTDSGKGFYLKYRTVCNTELQGYRGVIESPNFPNFFPSSMDCTWVITAPMGNKINVSFSHFNFEQDYCQSTYIEVKEGLRNAPPSNTIGKYCQAKPKLIASSLERVHVHFVSNPEVENGGNFRLEWVVNGCGGSFRKPSAEFTSPGYPNTYPPLTLCEWFITVDPSSSIRLTFSDINLEKSEQCVLDSVQVFGGADSSSPLLTKLCHGDKKQVQVESSGNQLYIKFQSDASGEGIGFRAKYLSIPSSKYSVFVQITKVAEMKAAKECGGRFISNFGSIHSRNYPQNYLAWDDCKWTIEVDTNHRVNLTFIDFDIENGGDGNCTKNFVEVYDGPTVVAPPLMRHCGNMLPNSTTILSTSNTLTVRMRSDGENVKYTAKGFLANYSIACGATIIATEPGVITLADHVNMVRHNKNCSWIITSPEPDGHITLTLNYMNIGPRDRGNESCEYNQLVVYEGDVLLGKHCGVTTPLPIISKGNTITMKLIGRRGEHQGHFSATYSSASSACGGELISERGSFATPNYPGNYPTSAECVWTLAPSPGNKIQIDFKEFDLESNPNCNEDYVEIRETDSTGKLVGVYCGDSRPSNLTSLTGLWLKFRSNSEGSGNSGFLANYNLVFGNELTGTTGQIASPFYPRPFIQYLESITYRITVNFTKVIQISFKNFRLETFDSSCGSGSYVTIHDGYDSTAPALIKACGVRKPDPVTSSSNVVLINFGNFPMVDGSLFLLEWNAIAKPSDIRLPSYYRDTGCGRFIDLTSPENRTTTITSPGYPNGTTGFVNCTWIVESPQEDHLVVTVQTLNLEPTPDCYSQSLTVYSGVDGMSEWKQLSKLCRHNESHTELTASNFVKINYVSRYVVNKKRGFSLTVERDCGGSIKKSNGVIRFDNWDNVLGRLWYRKDMSCEWDITVTPGRTINATFTSFNIGQNAAGTCHDKYIVLRNGGTKDSPLLGTGTYCTKPDNIPLTTSNRMFVKIRTVYKSSTFVLKFEEQSHECGGHFEINDQTNETIISSPNYPNIPPPKVECIWVFVASSGHQLQIDFLDRFDLTYSSECTVEYVELRDGGTELSDEIGRFCAEKPSTQKSLGNMLYVKYYSNATDPKNGFRARVSLARCGGVLRSNNGILTSPGYPDSYESNVDCRWEIESDLTHQININIMDLDLPLNFQPYENPLERANQQSLRIPTYTSFSGRHRFTFRGRHMRLRNRVSRPSRNCTSSATILITEPAPPDTPDILQSEYSNLSPGFLRVIRPYLLARQRRDTVLGNICSNDKPNPIKSSGNKISISYTSGELLSNPVLPRPRGFKLEFTSTIGGCDKDFNTASGVITSPTYPNERPNYYFCNMKIRVPKGRRVTVKVVDIDFVGASSEQRLTFYNDHNYRSRIDMVTKENGRNDAIYKSSSNLMMVNYWADTYTAGEHRGFKLEYNSDEPAICGGNITDSEGLIASPKNQSGFYCEWEFPHRWIQNQTIAFTVFDSKIGNRTYTCSMRYASAVSIIASGDSSDFEAHVCGNITSTTIRSPYTNVKILGIQSTYYGPVDFNLKYKFSPCGGPIYATEATITSPSYPSNYPADTDCAWLILFPRGMTIKLTFEDLQLQPSCDDFVTIRNGGSHESPLIGEYCGNTKPDKHIVSEGSSMLIEFHSDSKNQGKGFKINVEPATSVCGGVIHSAMVEIMTPNFPSDYGNNQECEWEIRSLEGSHVGLVFLDRFHLETSDNCQNDFLKIYDYVDDQWKEIKTLCGREFPTPVNSTSSRMKILFRSNGATTADGFKAKWEQNCGGTIYTDKEGTIMSPSHPLRYPNNLNCVYQFATTEYINLNFTFFDLEEPLRGYCKFDSVEIFEKGRYGQEYRSVGRYCGDSSPGNLRLKGPVRIEFTTDSYNGGRGFVLTHTHDGCGGYINKTTIIEFKGARGYDYDNRGNCTWTIEAPSEMIVVVRILQATLAMSMNCGTGLSFFEGNSTSDHLIGKICGRIVENMPTFRSTSNQLTIKMRKGWIFEDMSFTVSVVFSYVCGAKIDLGSNPELVISPDANRDGYYEEFLDCVWLIYAKPYHYITANFISIDMNSCNSTNCDCDYVEIRDGLDAESDLLTKACGKTLPTAVTSSGDAMMLRMITDGSYSGRGFSIQFSSQLSQCGYGTVTANETIQYLQSPNYPQNYPQGIRCRWVLTTGESTFSYYVRGHIYVHIEDWDIEDSVDCREDYLSLEDTGNYGTAYEFRSSWGVTRNRSSNGTQIIRGKPTYTDAHEKLKLCGKGTSIDFYSDSSEVTVSFVSNSGFTKKGFRMEISRAICSRNYTAEWGRIKQTRFKNDSHCFMTIIAPSANHTISLYFSTFYIWTADDSECLTSYFEVRDGPDVNSPLIGKYCGFTLPNTIFSNGQYLWLHVYTAQTRYRTLDELDLTYVTTDQGKGCGGRIFSSSGEITSPNYPNNYRKYSKCRWDVVVPANLEVSFRFAALDIGPANTCESDYIEFFDYDSSTKTETFRTKFCGGDRVAMVRSNTNAVIIKYTTSVNNGGSGWRLRFKAVAKGSSGRFY